MYKRKFPLFFVLVIDFVRSRFPNRCVAKQKNLMLTVTYILCTPTFVWLPTSPDEPKNKWEGGTVKNRLCLKSKWLAPMISEVTFHRGFMGKALSTKYEVWVLWYRVWYWEISDIQNIHTATSKRSNVYSQPWRYNTTTSSSHLAVLAYFALNMQYLRYLW